jgi:hypothetical protein
LSRYYAVEDESEHGMSDYIVHLDHAALDKIKEFAEIDTIVADIVYMHKKTVYGLRSNFFADEIDLISFLLDLKFIGPDVLSHESEEGKVFCVEQIMH